MSDEPLRGDELVSAYLDNEATPAEAAEVEQDDALLARAERLRAVRDAVAAPVSPASAAQREQVIGAALAVADAEAVERRQAGGMPLHRARRGLLAVAAAAITLAAVLSAGLIASRNGDDDAEMATEAPTAAETADAGSTGSAMADEPAEEESYAAPAEADAAFDDAMAAEMMAEEPAAMAEEEPMAEEAPATNTLVVSSDAEEMAAAEMAAAEMAAAETADDTRRDEEQQTATTPSSDSEPGEVAMLAVDLGTFDDIESLINGVAAHWSAGDPVDATLAERGACAAELDDRVAEMNAEAFQSFVAVIVTDEFAVTGAVLARHDDDSAFLAFGTEPDCNIGIQALEVPPEP